MIDKRFPEAKEALLQLMRENNICDDGYSRAVAATDLAGLIGVMNENRLFVGHSYVPATEWLRTYYGDDLPTLNKHGIYLDQEVEVRDQPVVWLYGKCVCNYFFTLPEIGELVVCDFSCALVHVTKSVLFRVYLVDNGIAEIADHPNKVRIYIKDRRAKR